LKEYHNIPIEDATLKENVEESEQMAVTTKEETVRVKQK